MISAIIVQINLDVRDKLWNSPVWFDVNVLLIIIIIMLIILIIMLIIVLILRFILQCVTSTKDHAKAQSISLWQSWRSWTNVSLSAEWLI